MTGRLIRKNDSHEPAMLSDSDIVSNTKSLGASIHSNELRDADLSFVTGGQIISGGSTHVRIPGGGFPIGRVYKPGL